jgi:predicted RNA-binding protein with PIN domain
VEEIIIDGCNLAYKAFGGSGEKERGALLRALKNRYARKRISVTIVFDSREGGDVVKALPNVKVLYVPAPADEYIVRRVYESERRGSLTVVTDDRSVGDKARGMGAKLISSRSYLETWRRWARPASGAAAAGEKPVSETDDGIKRYLDLWDRGR